MKSLKRLIKSQNGSLTEYALLVALIGLLTIASLKTLGERVENTFCRKIAAELGTAGGGAGDTECSIPQTEVEGDG